MDDTKSERFGREVSEQELEQFLNSKLGSRCLDDFEDRLVVVRTLLRYFNITMAR